jgi:Fe-S-cluster-containing hydrogenase component 2
MPGSSANPALHTYSPPWKGELVLACRKCQRRIRKQHGRHPLARIRRWFRKRGKRDPLGSAVHVIDIPCVKLCPRNAVTIITQRQAGVAVARSEADLERLYTALRS